MESSPRYRIIDPNSTYPPYNRSPATATATSLGPSKLRLLCSNGGHIVPRPHDKTLCYIGGETRMVVVDRHTTLQDLTHRLSKTLLRSSSSSTAKPPSLPSFILKYQLPSEDLDSLISVTTDEDLENMIDEYERLNSSSSRLRLFIFPAKPEPVSSIGSFLESSTKSEDWFVNALNGENSGVSDTSSVNCLLDFDDEISLPEKKDVDRKFTFGQDVHSISDSPVMETNSSFGSASSSPSVANLLAIRVIGDDDRKIVAGGGIEEQFSQMIVDKRNHKLQDDVGLMGSTAPVVVSGSPVSSTDHHLLLLHHHHHPLQPLQQQQQKQSAGFDLGSIDLRITDQSSSLSQIQSSGSNDHTLDQNTRIQMQQQQKVSNSAYASSTPPLQYIHHHHHHPSTAAPVTPYYQQHHHHPPMNHQNFMYYIPTSQPPQGYTFQFQQPPPNSAADMPPVAAGANSGAPQLVRVPPVYQKIQNQHQHVGYSEIHQPIQSLYYATQGMPPLSVDQYPKLTSISPVEARLQEQQVRMAPP